MSRGRRTAARCVGGLCLLLTFGLASCSPQPPAPSPGPTKTKPAPDAVTTAPVDPVETIQPSGPWDYGDDPYLDDLWDGCAAGDAASCDQLYVDSPVGSAYEAFGDTCGGLTAGGGCAPAPPVDPTFQEYAQITTWYTPAEADHSAWVHFKAVDGSGTTVQEALGSDLVDLTGEAEAMAMTEARVALVDQLRQMMLDDGWTELGVGGTEWYEYYYGR